MDHDPLLINFPRVAFMGAVESLVRPTIALALENVRLYKGDPSITSKATSISEHSYAV